MGDGEPNVIRQLQKLVPLLALTACQEPVAEPSAASRPARFTVAGELENTELREASGMTASARTPGILWLHNDSGSKARLYAIDHEGRHIGRLKLEEADNRDWEDIAAFVLGDTPYLLVADIGDNDARRKHVTLYIVEEPDLTDDDKQRDEPAWRIRYTYPDGPRDAEAVAVDTAGNRALILTKRDIPPVLYAVPLAPGSDETVIAVRLGPITSLPPPSRRDVEFAPHTKNWHWQPTAMDFAADGSAAIILTYAAIYYYPFDGDWFGTLNQQALGLGLRGIRDAEAAAFGAHSRQFFVTIERKRAPLIRIDMDIPES